MLNPCDISLHAILLSTGRQHSNSATRTRSRILEELDTKSFLSVQNPLRSVEGRQYAPELGSVNPTGREEEERVRSRVRLLNRITPGSQRGVRNRLSTFLQGSLSFSLSRDAPLPRCKAADYVRARRPRAARLLRVSSFDPSARICEPVSEAAVSQERSLCNAVQK